MNPGAMMPVPAAKGREAVPSFSLMCHAHLWKLLVLLLRKRYLCQVVYGADKQPWARVRAALRKGEKSDGEVTLVLERRCGEQ
jgi:hypothetical protein